jgi:hypothetical protein
MHSPTHRRDGQETRTGRQGFAAKYRSIAGANPRIWNKEPVIGINGEQRACGRNTMFGSPQQTFNKLSIRRLSHLCAATALLCGLALSLNAVSRSAAETFRTAQQFVDYDNANTFNDRNGVRAAVADFIDGMVQGDTETVWMYATEEDQAAFGTEAAVYNAFAEVFPAFAEAERAVFQRAWREGDTPFVQLSLTNSRGEMHVATIGLWLDDAGDWEIVSCDVRPATALVA